MNLRTRTLAITGATLVVLLLALYGISRAIILGSALRSEEQTTRRDVERATQALSRNLARLNATAGDWAYWDDSYAFVENQDPAYVEANLGGPALANLDVNLIAFANTSGEIVFAEAFDPVAGHEGPTPADLQAMLSGAGLLAPQDSPDDARTGIILLAGEPYLVAARPILTSEWQGPVRGTLVMGRAIHASLLEEIADVTQLQVRADSVDDPALPEDSQRALDSTSVGEPVYMSPLSEDTIAGYVLLPDIQGQPLLLLQIQAPRDAYALGKESLLEVSLSILIVGLVLGGVTLRVLETMVLTRLERLSASVDRLAASGDPAGRVQVQGADELGRLGEAINGMLARVQSSQQEIRESEERFRAIFESAQDVIFIKDLQLRYTHVNPAMENLFGLTALDLQGQDDVSIWGEEASRGIQEVDRRVLQGDVVDEEIVRTVRGVTHTFHMVKAPMKDAVGEITGLCGVARDITERSRAEGLREAVYRVSQAASTVRDLDELYRSVHAIVSELMPAQNLYVALHDPAAETISFPYFVDQVDDRPQPRGKGGGLTEYVLRTGKPLLASPEVFEDLVLRGEVEEVGAPSVDWLGVPLQAGQKVLGVLAVQSYTQSVRYREDDQEVLSFVAEQVAMAIESKRAEEAQRQGEERFQFLVESLGEGVAIVDIHDRFTFANPAAGLILGVDPGWLLGRSLEEFTSMQQFYGLQEQVQRRRAGERSTYELEILRPDGEKHSVVLTVTPRLGANGEVTGYIGVFRDVTEGKQAEQRLRYLSTHDALTGLYNRAYFEEEMARVERGRLFPVSAVVSDIDHLKPVNDRDGHAAGDDLLRRAAAVLQAAFRSEDVVARIGGDEFAVLLPGADASAAERALVRVRNGLRIHNGRYPGQSLSLSLGIATGERGCSMASLLQEADARMYLDKQQKVEASSSPPEAP
jgi:diguanylate cyclase (GGDEF)-like protein/PAS domain S-box-containing protein